MALPLVQFLPEGIGFADFGDNPDPVMAAAELLFGAPTSDTGWLAGGFGDYGVCPGTEFRRVSYLADTLILIFSDADYFAGGGVRNFISYAYSGPTMLTAGPPASVDIGTTVAEVLSIYPTAIVVGDDPLLGPSFYYTPGSGYEGVYGILTGTTDSDVVTYVVGGVGCGE